MVIVFYLYKNALARHIYVGAHPSVNAGTIEYKLIAQFPENMYKDVKKLVESYKCMHSNLEISVYDYITAEQSGFAHEYQLKQTS